MSPNAAAHADQLAASVALLNRATLIALALLGCDEVRNRDQRFGALILTKGELCDLVKPLDAHGLRSVVQCIAGILGVAKAEELVRSSHRWANEEVQS